VRLLVVNPNTTAGMTATIAAAARGAAAPGTEIDALNPAMGPASIEGYYDEAFALPGLLQEIGAAEQRGCQGAVIACFDDTGLDAARSLVTMPVVGICEAAMHVASLIAGKFVVVTTLSRSIPPLEMLARRYGMAERCRILAAEIPVLALEHPTPEVTRRLTDECRRAIDVDRAEAIILGCAGMTALAAMLAAELGLPVIDGVVAGVKLVEALVGLGLKTSKRGGYAKPLAKPYKGLLEPFAPKG
jgi:allantoin racemase